MGKVTHEDIELSFFETDEENKVAKVIMKYEKPEDLSGGRSIIRTRVSRR